MIEIGPQTQPLQVFQIWMDEAKKTSGIREATAMTVATQSENGQLNARVVLCKDWSESGFTFFSNYQSRKGLDLQHNSQVAAVFYWDPMFRQINISGRVSRTSREVSVAYWNSRPRESQLSQYISRQSETVGSRAELERQRSDVEKSLNGNSVPCPEHWGGYLLNPERIEFWQGQPNRLHDRYEFLKVSNHWTYRRLYP